MHTEYRRMSEADLYWRKRHVRYAGMFFVVATCLTLIGCALLAASKYPIESLIAITSSVVGVFIGRATK